MILGNNLYGWAMSQYMPYGGFRWVDATLDGLFELDEKAPIGYMYEVDISYPRGLHDMHNDLPFLPENGIPSGSKIQKLMVTFTKKERYVIHYQNLQQAINNGLIVEKVNIFIFLVISIFINFIIQIHRVLQFNQSPWLAEYISLNTEMRKKAENDFEKDFFKLTNNAVFGKFN
jgi:hypothetical protein